MSSEEHLSQQTPEAANDASNGDEQTDTSTGAAQSPGSTPEAQERREAARANRVQKGLVIVNTGNGKGKTTAALGILLRAWGRDMRVGGIQFLKHENANYGELRALKRMGIELTPMGDGFTWTSRDLDETQAKAVHGWETAKARIASGAYDIFLLDEFTYVLNYGWVDTTDVIDWLRQHKPPMLHLIITGRNAPQALIDFADLVTEMREVKHPFRDQGIRAQKGVEY
jgi:cob(I)alamin adenosyltransferase